MRLSSMAAIVVGGAICVFVGRSVVMRAVVAPRAEAVERIDALRRNIEVARRAENEAPEAKARLRSIAAQTLGADAETVDHRLRTRLNRIAEEAGLAGPVVTTTKPLARLSPARTAMPRSTAWRSLRDEPDFIEIDATLTGEGPIDTVVTVVDRVEAEPWLKRMGRVRLDAKDGGDRFVLSVTLTTIFLPGVSTGDDVDSPLYDRRRLDRLAALLAANPFRVPPPPEPVRQVDRGPRPRPAPPPPPPPPQFPWSEWVLTGVAEARGVAEAWLRNTRSGEVRRLEVGGTMDSATLEAIETDAVRLRIPEGLVRVIVGSTLADRVMIAASAG